MTRTRQQQQPSHHQYSRTILYRLLASPPAHAVTGTRHAKRPLDLLRSIMTPRHRTCKMCACTVAHLSCQALAALTRAQGIPAQPSSTTLNNVCNAHLAGIPVFPRTYTHLACGARTSGRLRLANYHPLPRTQTLPLALSLAAPRLNLPPSRSTHAPCETRSQN